MAKLFSIGLVMGSGTTKADGDIKLDLNDSYGQFAELHLCNSGVVRSAA